MKRLRKIIPVIILFIAGLSLLLYPLISNTWNNYRQKQLMTDYSSAVAELESSGNIDYEMEWQRAYDYNNGLLPSILPDSFAIADASEDTDAIYMSCLNLTGDGMMGTVEIPKINITIPIYHTTEAEVLEQAAGHLEGSSLPVGGENTHAVISAHRGLPSASLFTDLDQLEIGDHFLLHILNDTLAYEVDQILTVDPDETEALSVEMGKDLVTLLTCTPYGVNTQRLLVRGHRVDYEPEVLAEEAGTASVSLHTNYALWVVVGLVITAVFIIIFYFLQKKHEKKMTEREMSGISEGETDSANDEKIKDADMKVKVKESEVKENIETKRSEGSKSENKEEGRE